MACFTPPLGWRGSEGSCLRVWVCGWVCVCMCVCVCVCVSVRVLRFHMRRDHIPSYLILNRSFCCCQSFAFIIGVVADHVCHHFVGQIVAGSNSRLKISTSDAHPLLGDPTILLSIANTTSWNAPWNSSSSKSSFLHIRATSCAGLRNMGPKPKAPSTKFLCPQ